MSANGQQALLAAWGAVTTRGGTAQDALAYLRSLYRNVVALEPGARTSTITFSERHIGDVHVTWEDEALREVGANKDRLEIVRPPVSIRLEPAVAWVDANNRDANTAAHSKAYLEFLFSDTAQEALAQNGFRSINPAIMAQHRAALPDMNLFPITAIAEDWDDAQQKFFGDDGILDIVSSPVSLLTAGCRTDRTPGLGVAGTMVAGFDYSWLKGRRDVVAGLTVAAVALPQAMAYALIAGVDPKFGVYSAIVITFVASVFGSSSHLINGPTSAIALLVFSSLSFLDQENRTVLFESLFLMGILVGVIQILIAIFKLGDLTRYISESVIIGFLVAAALLLAVGQIGPALGVKDKGNGHMHLLHRLSLTLFHGDPINYRAVVLSVTAVAVAVLLRMLVKRYRWPQLDLMAVLVVTGVIAYAAGWSIPNANGKTAVNVTAKIPQTLPGFHVPTVDLGNIGELSQGALAIAFIGLIEALSIAKAIAHQTHQKVDYNRQILAEGLGNLTGGFFQSLPGSGSLTRSAINFQAGAVSRFSGIVSAATVAGVLLLFAPLLHYVPQAALAGLLLVTAARLVDYKRLLLIVRASRYDAGLVIVTALTGILLDLDKAVLVGVAMSILLFVPRAAKLKARELTVTPNAWCANGCQAIRSTRRRSSTTSRASCSSAPRRNSTGTWRYSASG